MAYEELLNPYKNIITVQSILKYPDGEMEYASEGEWSTEPDECYFVHNKTNTRCFIKRNRLGCLCGYIIIPQRILKDVGIDVKDPYSSDYRVHGGITFGEFPDEFRYMVHYVIGFHTSHFEDIIPKYEKNYNFSEDVYKNFQFVLEQTISLANQVYNKINGVK